MRFLSALLLLSVSLPSWAAMTMSGTDCFDAAGTAQNPTIALPTNVPAAATIVLGISTTTDETTTVSSVTDPVNGTWGAAASGPERLSGASVGSSWMYYFVNSAALSTAGNRTLTVNFSGSVTYALVACWGADDAGAQTFDEYATVRNNGTGETDVNSNTVALDSGGGIVGFLWTNNQQSAPEPSTDSGETKVSPQSATGRAHMFFEASASGGTIGIDTTIDSAATMFHVAGFLTPGGGSSSPDTLSYYRRRLLN